MMDEVGKSLARAGECALEDILPHRPPMIFIDRLVAFDVAAKRVVCEATVTEKQLFFDGLGVPSHVAIEYMAQAAAALVGVTARAKGEAPRPGLLLGTRRLELGLDRFVVGKTYRITATCAFEDTEAAAFDCTIMDDAGKIVATASLNAYSPPNMKEFLEKERTL